jgi:Lysine-specific metallo-endopeptidase
MRYLFFVIAVLGFALGETALADEPACHGADLATAKAATRDAKAMVASAIAALDSPSAREQAIVAKWLNVRNSAEASDLKGRLSRIAQFADGATFQCAVRSDAELGDYYAYVHPDQSFVIVLGAFFYTAGESGFSSKAGIIVHEISHFLLAGASADPEIYGPAQAQALAKSDPAAAQRNAENIEYFVEAIAYGL